MKTHHYPLQVRWTGNTGEGTKTYRGYRRDHVVSAAGKAELLGSSAPEFRGDASRYNPEELLVASLSTCHMLWYLHMCSENGVVAEEYVDEASGRMAESEDGSGEFTEVVLRPTVKISAGDEAVARALHEKAHKMCFIARSVNFPVNIEPIIERVFIAK